MSVKISKLWKDSGFQKLPDATKLLYLYLVTNPDLNMVGVFSPNLEILCIELGITMDSLRESTKILQDSKKVYVKSYGNLIYFVVPEHFNSIPKSESTVSRVNKVFNSLPDEMVIFLDSIGISINSKVREFKRPSPEEIMEYGLSLGHLIQPEVFIGFYEEQSVRYGKKDIWVDGRGTEVRDWKAKLRKVWLKEDNKIKTFKDAPKGYESFHIIENGAVVTPDGWKNGKPWSKGLTSDIMLKREYERRKTDS